MSELKRHEKEKKEKSFLFRSIYEKNKKDQHKNNMFKYFRNLNSMSLILFRFHRFAIVLFYSFISYHSFSVSIYLHLQIDYYIGQSKSQICFNF